MCELRCFRFLFVPPWDGKNSDRTAAVSNRLVKFRTPTTVPDWHGCSSLKLTLSGGTQSMSPAFFRQSDRPRGASC